MKRISTLFLTMAVCLTMQAQVDLGPIKKLTEADYRPQFLGIPVDGTVAHMTSAIKAKGFKYDTNTEVLTGQFNGRSVKVYIHSNHDIVDRIMVVYCEVNENQIKNEFNTLLRQFQNNAKYIELVENVPIPENEDVSYEMTAHNKRYESSFFYLPPQVSIVNISNRLKDLLIEIRKGETIEGLEEICTDMEALNGIKDAKQEEWDTLMNMKQEEWENVVKYIFWGQAPQNSIWFTINELYGKYTINIFYDNEMNRPNGEDL